MTHFAQSDETDKTFANLQMSRFDEVMRGWRKPGSNVPCRHLCNSGGFLDVPQAHSDMVRVGIFMLGIYPSSVCRRLSGRGAGHVSQSAHRRDSTPRTGRSRWLTACVTPCAKTPRRIAVLPLGYGDGFPVRNQGAVLIHGQRAPLVGGVAMDAFMVDITEIPAAQNVDEAVIMAARAGEISRRMIWPKSRIPFPTKCSRAGAPARRHSVKGDALSTRAKGGFSRRGNGAGQVKLLFSEQNSDYEHYQFPYAIWAVPEDGESPADIFNAGFLPSSRNLDRFHLVFKQVRGEPGEIQAVVREPPDFAQGRGIDVKFRPARTSSITRRSAASFS